MLCVKKLKKVFVFKCTYLKFSFCVLCVRNTHNLIICKLRKTLQVLRQLVWMMKTLQPSLLDNITEGRTTCRKLKEVSYIKVPERQNSDNHGSRGPAFAVRAVEHEGRVRVLSQGTLHGLQQLIKLLRTRSHTQTRISIHLNISLFNLALSVSQLF